MSRQKRIIWFIAEMIFVIVLLVVAWSLWAAGEGDASGSTELIIPVRVGFASWYSVESCRREGTSGVLTASGEMFFNECDTCAMRGRDFGRYYKVTNVSNGKLVVVRHNDFGPSKRLREAGRIVDLSKGAFARIADLDEGVIEVEIEQAKKESWVDRRKPAPMKKGFGRAWIILPR